MKSFNLYKFFQNNLSRLPLQKSNKKIYFIIHFFISFFIFDLSKAESNNNLNVNNNSEISIDYLDSKNELKESNLYLGKSNINKKNINQLSVDYIKSKNNLEDYIIDTGDALFIEFENMPRGLNSMNQENQNQYDPNKTSYLEPKNDLRNYKLDEGDVLNIKFLYFSNFDSIKKINQEGEIYLPELGSVYVKGLNIYQLKDLLEKKYEKYLKFTDMEIEINEFRFITSGIYNVDQEGEIFLPRIKETYVRGLTPNELSKILQEKYSEFNINAKTTIKIAKFKKLRILVGGEVRSPGVYRFPALTVLEYKNITDEINQEGNEKTYFEKGKNIFNEENKMINQRNTNENSIQEIKRDFQIKSPNENVTTISNVIRKAGGLTSKTDLSRIEVIRDVPIGKGGGKKRTVIDFTSYLNEGDPTYDIRLFDGDRIFLPKLASAAPEIIPKSILAGLSPKFITVNIFGRVENPGAVKLPLEAALSDAINLTGPIKPLSGKIVLIRYNKDGTILNKNISYLARAERGSRRNPFVKEGDLISVKNSVLGRATGIIKEVTEPFVGIYTTKSIFDDLNE